MPLESSGQPKTFLFLQGHPSFFARDLATSLELAGARVLRVNFCAGDALFWWPKRAFNYRGAFRDWSSYIETLIRNEGVTDILYYGDARPYHEAAARVAKRLGVKTFVYEFGYLRPDWITLERGGMSKKSHFPVDPVNIYALGQQFPDPDFTSRYPYSAAGELANEIIYTLSTYFTPFLFPRYEADRYYNPVLEYIAGVPKQLSAGRSRAQANKTLDELRKHTDPLFFMPLQLQSDYQLRKNSEFAHQSQAIDMAIKSFAVHAPAASRLLFKSHPLDNGWEAWHRCVLRSAKKAGVAHRVLYIDAGNLGSILNRCSGVVVINSTVGMHALLAGCPLKVLGTAIFDVAGLSFQGCLDSFWQHARAPDRALVRQFVRALAGTIQIKGNFFTPSGRAAAIQKCVERLMDGTVNGGGAYIDPPPRLTLKSTVAK